MDLRIEGIDAIRTGHRELRVLDRRTNDTAATPVRRQTDRW
jgi:hypothetical protein